MKGIERIRFVRIGFSTSKGKRNNAIIKFLHGFKLRIEMRLEAKKRK